MTDSVLALAEDAGRLIAFGLKTRIRPSQDASYADLLGRYRSEGAFREYVHTVARGLGLSILGETEHGLVLGADEEGPFALRLTDYRRSGLSVDERLCHGLIQLAVAAWCFPTAQSLEDPDTVAGTKISARLVVGYLVDLCNQLKEANVSDSEQGSEELREAWRLVLSRAETRSSSDGRRSPSTLTGMVTHALEYLERGGLLRKLSEEDGGTWQALASYRLQVRELAAHDAARLVREAASKCATESRGR